VFGPEDGFFNRFAHMARFVPALPLIGGGATQFQPVYCGDVAECAVRALEMEAARGQVFELGGPSVYTFRELMTYILKTIDRQRLLIPVPFPIATLMGLGGEIAGALPFVEPFLTRDQVTLLKQDNVVGAGGEGLGRIDAFGVTPEAIEAIVPSYLARYRKGGQFAAKRKGV